MAVVVTATTGSGSPGSSLLPAAAAAVNAAAAAKDAAAAAAAAASGRVGGGRPVTRAPELKEPGTGLERPQTLPPSCIGHDELRSHQQQLRKAYIIYHLFCLVQFFDREDQVVPVLVVPL